MAQYRFGYTTAEDTSTTLFHFFEILSNDTCVYGQLHMGTQYTQIAALWHACPPKENPKPLEKRPENQNPSPTPR
jgi:hypothetical protein